MGGPSPGSDGGPPGAVLPIEWTVGGSLGQLVAYSDLEFYTKSILVTLPQMVCMAKNLRLCM